jgi:predicted RNA-binding protein with PIN domain
MSTQPGVERLVVDGYNLIKAWPRLRRQERASLELARRSLVRALAEYAARTPAQVVLVFDGDGGTDLPAAQRCGGVQVLFARAPQKADDVIAELVQRLHRSQRARVISSDRQVRGAARRHRVRSSTADEFVRQLEEPARRSPAPAAAAAPEAMDEVELAAWERLFREERGMFEDEE